MTKFGERLKELREARGMSQFELAAEAGTDQSNISAYEIHGVQPRLEQIEALAKALKIRSSVLLSVL